MACRSLAGESAFAVQGHQLAQQGRGSLVAAPSDRGGGNGRQVARPRFALLPVAVLRSLRLGGGSRHFWLGVFCPRYSRNARRGLWAAALTWTKTISRPSAPRPPARAASGATMITTVLADGIVVGRIMKTEAAPVGSPWMWTLAFGHHEDRTPTHGYAATREAAMAAFAKSWRRE